MQVRTEFHPGMAGINASNMLVMSSGLATPTVSLSAMMRTPSSFTRAVRPLMCDLRVPRITVRISEGHADVHHQLLSRFPRQLGDVRRTRPTAFDAGVGVALLESLADAERVAEVANTFLLHRVIRTALIGYDHQQFTLRCTEVYALKYFSRIGQLRNGFVGLTKLPMSMVS
jgi:hypothetical protein